MVDSRVMKNTLCRKTQHVNNVRDDASEETGVDGRVRSDIIVIAFYAARTVHRGPSTPQRRLSGRRMQKRDDFLEDLTTHEVTHTSPAPGGWLEDSKSTCVFIGFRVTRVRK